MKKYIKYTLALSLGVLSTGMLAQNSESVENKFVLDVHVAPVLTELKSEKFSSSTSSKGGFIGGVDVVYYFKTYQKINMGVSLGLGYSFYSSQIGLNYADSLWTTDTDNENVHLFETGNNLKETQKASFIDIPILLHFDYPISTKFDAYLNTGPVISFVVSQTYSNTANYTAKGYYPKYNSMFFNVDVPSSPYYFPTNKPMSGSGSLNMKSSIDYVLNIGTKYHYKPNIDITGGFTTLFGFSKSNKNTNAQLVLPDKTSNLNSLMNLSEKYSKFAIGFQIGVVWKFQNAK